MRRRDNSNRMRNQSTAESLQCSVLSNGLQIFSERVDSVRSVSIGLWVRTGSGNETIRQGGISHLTEHMLFKGTRRRTTRQIAQRLESVGGYLNAFTSKEYTCYYARCMDKHIARAVDLLGDMVTSPSLLASELEKEKDVVVEEMQMYRDSPEDHIFDYFESAIYPSHAFGRPILGTEKSVRNISRHDLETFVRTRYVPNRMFIVASGNVHHDKLVLEAEKSLGALDRGSKRNSRRRLDAYQPVVKRIERPIGQAHVVVGTRVSGVKADMQSSLVVLNALLGGGMSGMLNQNIREKYGYCYNVYSFLNSYSAAGDFGVYAGCHPDKVDTVAKLIVDNIKKVGFGHVSNRAVDQARNQLCGSLILGLESMTNRMMRIGRQQISEKRFMSVGQVIERVNSVSKADLADTAAAILDNTPLSSITLLPLTDK